MLLQGHWKRWTFPLCLAASLAAAPVLGDELETVESDQVTESNVEPDPLAPADEYAGGTVTDLESSVLMELELSEESLEPEPEAEDAPLASETVEDEPLAEDFSEPVDATPAPPARDTSEVIEERYPNGSLRIVREVVQDEKGNYLNHGPWKMFNERGTVVVDGQYYEDERHGVWNRWYTGGEVSFLRQKPFTDFIPPFISQGMFDSGDLHGAWIIYDAKQRKVCEIRFNHGEREGAAVWFHANGRKMREMKFERGVVNGLVQEWHPDGSVSLREMYDEGRKQTVQTMYYGGNVKKFTGSFLEPPLAAQKLDNWWEGTMATYSSTGKSVKHGPYQAWHPNGQNRMSGEYKYDVPVGTFTWWFANGQKALEGSYDDGKQEGEWNWWHENGQPSIRGYFTLGNPSGKWNWWNKEGKVAQTGDFSDDKGQIVVSPMLPAPSAPQQAEVPATQKPPRR
jgi:antitoxin component YwqK of YwqJK toxin-antitoxin module